MSTVDTGGSAALNILRTHLDAQKQRQTINEQQRISVPELTSDTPVSSDPAAVAAIDFSTSGVSAFEPIDLLA